MVALVASAGGLSKIPTFPTSKRYVGANVRNRRSFIHAGFQLFFGHSDVSDVVARFFFFFSLLYIFSFFLKKYRNMSETSECRKNPRKTRTSACYAFSDVVPTLSYTSDFSGKYRSFSCAFPLKQVQGFLAPFGPQLSLPSLEPKVREY